MFYINLKDVMTIYRLYIYIYKANYTCICIYIYMYNLDDMY